MKITYLLARGDEAGGVERAVHAQVRQLAERHDVEVLSATRTRPEPLLGLRPRHLIDRTRTPARPLRASRLDDETCRTLTALPSRLPDPEGDLDRLADVELAAALSALDTDVLVTTGPALLAAAAAHVPARVVTLHQEFRPPRCRDASVEALLLHGPRLDALVTPTEPGRRRLAEFLGPGAPEPAVIPHAAPDGFRPAADGESRVLVTVAPPAGEHRADQAVRAFARVADAHPDWTLRVFADDGAVPELRRLTDGLGLHDRVQLLGLVRDMAAEWAEAGLALLTCAHDEAFPLTLLDALTAGVPVVAYEDPAGPAEIVRHGVDGLLAPPGDVDGLAAALGSLLGDPETRHGCALAARRGAYDRFSPVRVTGLWEELCARLVARRDRPERLAERADRVAAAIVAGGGAFRPAAPAAPGALSVADESARENELLECGASRRLVRSAGRLAEERDDLTLPAAVDRNLQLTASALELYGIPYVLVRTGGTTHTLAVDADDRDRALKALAEAASGEAVYAELLGPRGMPPGEVLAERLDCVGEVAGVKVFRPATTSTRTLRYGADAACTVEFWPAERDGGPWRAPFGPTLAGPRLPSLRPTAHLTVSGRPYPTVDVFTQRLLDDIDFPVDAVCAATTEADLQLRHCLRSLSQYAPWLRRVHLLLAGPRPEWLAEDRPGLTVVEDAETPLARIEGLAEHFLYLDDTMFLGRPTTPGTFFLGSGLPRVFRSPTVNAPAADADLLRRDFGRTLDHGLPHAPYALRRSVLDELAERYGPAPSPHLHHHYACLTGRAVPDGLAYADVDLAEPAGHARLGRILHGRDRTAFRITASPHGTCGEQERTLALRAFLTAYFPVPSPYERPRSS
ncbi:glycosyltransferase [Streptomyces sp. Da 82-17]|uniref:glycosyltransferase n=1 Tax=Streptomyces sp. Da 82-17 TaxID=3377116 RepID=UPI0038D3B882